jgi:hypothetical protein
MISEPQEKSKQHSTVKKLQAFSKRLKNKKLLMSQKNNKNHKIWVDVQVEQIDFFNDRLRSNWQLYFATSNRNARTNTVTRSKPMQIYIINREFKWITDQVHIEVIILEDSQKLMFDVLNSIKYDVILKMLWLHKKNSRIDWISKELYITVDV